MGTRPLRSLQRTRLRAAVHHAPPLRVSCPFAVIITFILWRMGKKDKIKLKLTTLVRIFMRVVLIKLNCTRCEALALGASWRVLLVPMVAAARTVPKSGQRYYSAAQAAPATNNSAVSCVEFAHASEALCCADFLPTQVSLTAFFSFPCVFF